MIGINSAKYWGRTFRVLATELAQSFRTWLCRIQVSRGGPASHDYDQHCLHERPHRSPPKCFRLRSNGRTRSEDDRLDLIRRNFREQLTPEKFDEFRREWLQKIPSDFGSQIREIEMGAYQLNPDCANYQPGQAPPVRPLRNISPDCLVQDLAVGSFRESSQLFAFAQQFPTRARIIQVFETDNRFVESRVYFRFEFEQPATMRWTVDQSEESVGVTLSPLRSFSMSRQTLRVPICSSSN